MVVPPVTGGTMRRAMSAIRADLARSRRARSRPEASADDHGRQALLLTAAWLAPAQRRDVARDWAASDESCSISRRTSLFPDRYPGSRNRRTSTHRPPSAIPAGPTEVEPLCSASSSSSCSVASSPYLLFSIRHQPRWLRAYFTIRIFPMSSGGGTSPAAGGGFVDPSVVNAALGCLTTGSSCGSFHPPQRWPGVRGAMTRSINHDGTRGFAG
jgi:hypothetical protein